MFAGIKGRLKLTKLVDIVDDSNGMVFATRDGKLRLLVDGNGDTYGATWIDGKKRRKLEVLPLNRNRRLVFDELGVYAGQDRGTVCDEI